MKKPKWTFQWYWAFDINPIPTIRRRKLEWKDKFESPRVSWCPSITIEWLGVGFYGQRGEEEHWEQWLWVWKFCDGDYEKGKSTWPWLDWDTKNSTWKDY